VIVVVVDLQSAGAGVAHDHVGFAGDAAEIAEAAELPFQADRARRGGVGGAVVADEIELEGASIGIVQHHVGHAILVEIGEAGDLPIQADRAQRGGVGDVVVADVVDLEGAGIGVAQKHVGGIGAEEAAERDERPIGSDLGCTLLSEAG